MKNLPKEKRNRLILIGVLTVIAGRIYYFLIKASRIGAARSPRRSTSRSSRSEVRSGSLRLFDIKKNVELANQKLASIEETMASGICTPGSSKPSALGAGTEGRDPQFSRE